MSLRDNCSVVCQHVAVVAAALAAWLGVSIENWKLRIASLYSMFNHTDDLEIDVLMGTLPDTWCSRVHAGTGWPSVKIM